MNLTYTYDSPWREEYLRIWNSLPNIEYKPQIIEVMNGLLLPPKPSAMHYWGEGGIVSEDGELVPSSIVNGPFGGKYSVELEEITTISGSALYLGILPPHWGHFIIDLICRLWGVLSLNNDLPIVCFSPKETEPLLDRFFECFDLLGIHRDRIIIITKPTIFSSVLIPEASMGYSTKIAPLLYRNTINCIVENAYKKISNSKYPIYEKIYLTRRSFSKKDIGEDTIEKAFVMNGFIPISLEKYTLIEQIHFVHSAKIIAALSGTLTHNYIFSDYSNAHFIILNRFPRPNPPQFRINYIFNLNYIWIDVYNKWQLKHPQDYGSPKIWVEFSEQLAQFFKTNHYQIPCFLFLKKIRNSMLFLYKWVIVPLFWDVLSFMLKQKKKLYENFSN